MSVSRLEDHAWRRARVGDLPPPARALFDAIVQFTPDEIVNDRRLLDECQRALCTVLMHPQCPPVESQLAMSREDLMAFLTDFTTKSLRDANDVLEIHLDMMAHETSFDPRTLPTVERIFNARATRTCMHRYVGAIAVAYVYSKK